MEAIATSASPLDPPGGASPHNNRSPQQPPGFGPATDSAAPSAVCEKTLHPATNPTSRRDRPLCTRLGESRSQALALTSPKGSPVVADSAGPAPQGASDDTDADAGRRHANTQMQADVAETLNCRLPMGARGANPETVHVAMPRAPVWVAAIAPDSRSPTVLTFLEADRRPKPD